LPTTETTLLRQLAKRGAELRLDSLLAEVSALTKMFPDLKHGSNGRLSASATASTTEATTASNPAEATPVRKRQVGRRRWTAAQRKAQAAKMKAYWAKRKRA